MNRLQGHAIEQHVRITHEDYRRILLALFKRIVGLFLGHFVLGFFVALLLVVSFSGIILLVLRFAVRESGLEFAAEANGQRIGGSGRFELFADGFTREIGHETVHNLGVLRAFEQHSLF